MTKSDDKKRSQKNVITTHKIYLQRFIPWKKTLIPLFIKNDKTVRLKLFD